MTSRPASNRPSTALHAALWALAAAVACGAPLSAHARGAGPAEPARQQPDFESGARFFDQAIQYVSGGRPPFERVDNFFADLSDVQIRIEGNQQEGFVRMWFRDPHDYRFEIRPQRALASTTTKILSGEKLWIVDESGQTRALHGTADGPRAIAQQKKDRDRLRDLARFLTLSGLKGPNISFDYETLTDGSGPFAGRWIKVNRVVGNQATMVFFFAFEADPQGRPLRATYPGVVTVVGDAAKDEHSEFYVLRKWKDGPRFRYPTQIEAYTMERPDDPLRRFLLAFPNDIRINAEVQDALFVEPPPAAAQPK